ACEAKPLGKFSCTGGHSRPRELLVASERRRIERFMIFATKTVGEEMPVYDAGEKFSANGDDLVFADKLDEPVNAIPTGFPPQAPRGTAPVGPHSMALIDLGDEHGPVWVHDGTMMALMAALAPLENLLRLKVHTALRLLKEGIYGDDMSRSQILYVVAHD